MNALFSLLLLAFASFSNAAYMVGYYQGSLENQNIINNDGASFASLTSEHVADLYTRVSGLPPLTWEDKNMPGVDLLSNKIMRPQIVEVVGGVLPESVKIIAKAHMPRDPPVDDVLRVLRENGIEGVVTKRLDATGDKAKAVHEYLSSQSDPVLVLHSTLPLSSARMNRRLTVNNVTELDERQISQYQICLWVGVFFVLLILASVCGVANMDVEPDSLLYAKFQVNTADGKRD